MENPIQITNDSLYFTQYCTNYTGDSCIERLTVLWMWKEELKQSWVEVLTTCAVFILVIMILVRLIKWIFRFIIPTRWRK